MDLRGITALPILACLGSLAAGSPQGVEPASVGPQSVGPQSGDPQSGDVPARVLALLQLRCAECHVPGAEDPKALDDWDTADDLAATRDLLVEPGLPDESDLWLVIDYDEMPPPDSDAEPLTAEERSLLHDWIASGAPLGELVANIPDGDTEPPATMSAGPEAGPIQETKSDRGANVRRWLGRTHPSIVHFPIALLLAAALAEALVLLGASGLRPAVRFCVILGFLGAVAAASLGWLAGEFASRTAEPQLTWHKWLGVGTAVLALLLLLASEARVRRGDPSPWTACTRWLLLLTAVVVSVTGHFGGILTHGADYLSLPW